LNDVYIATVNDVNNSTDGIYPFRGYSCVAPNTWTNRGFQDPNRGRWPYYQHSPQDDATLLNNLRSKVSYAKNRWGVTMFYIDSTVYSNNGGGLPISFEIFRQLQREFPDCLFFPENEGYYYYGASVPYNQVNAGSFDTATPAKYIYPQAFSVLANYDGVNFNDQTTHNRLVQSVKNGNIFMVDAWWNSPDNAEILKIYREVAASSPTNQSPAVSAGNAQTITLPAIANLSGLASDDGLPTGSVLTTIWSMVSGPGTIVFTNASSLNTTATFPIAGTYIIRLSASDSALTSTSNITITVNPATVAPVSGSCSAAKNTCSTGTFSDTTDSSTGYLWQCLGLNGGSNADCSLTKNTPPPAGNGGSSSSGGSNSGGGGSSSNSGGGVPVIPVSGACSNALNICSTGVFSNLADSATGYLWQCLGSDGGSTTTCSLAITPSGSTPATVSTIKTEGGTNPASFPITNNSLYERLKGKIILRVESHGEAYYISPKEKKAYYLGRPNDAFQVMRSQGVGITNADLGKIPMNLSLLSGLDLDNDGLPNTFEEAIGTNQFSPDTDSDGSNDQLELANSYSPLIKSKKLNYDQALTNRQRGRVLLQVENHGEAWYINPTNSQRYFLARPTDAFNLMRKLGVGISNANFGGMGGK